MVVHTSSRRLKISICCGGAHALKTACHPLGGARRARLWGTDIRMGDMSLICCVALGACDCGEQTLEWGDM